MSFPVIFDHVPSGTDTKANCNQATLFLNHVFGPPHQEDTEAATEPPPEVNKKKKGSPAPALPKVTPQAVPVMAIQFDNTNHVSFSLVLCTPGQPMQH